MSTQAAAGAPFGAALTAATAKANTTVAMKYMLIRKRIVNRNKIKVRPSKIDLNNATLSVLRWVLDMPRHQFILVVKDKAAGPTSGKTSTCST
jgi:hypothetical protein